MIGAFVRDLRESRNLSRAAISQATNGAISGSHLAGLEAGTKRWNVDHLVAIAAVFGMEPRDLVPPYEARPNPAPAPALPPAKQALLDAVDDAGPEALAAAARVLARALEAARG